MNFKDTKFLDGLRIILALWVGIGHLYQHVGGEKLFRFPMWALLKYPGPAVDGFMVITGFLMMYHYSSRQDIESPHEKATKIRFYQKRFFRLYPVFLVVIVCGFITYPIINHLAILMNDYFEEGPLVSFTYGPAFEVGWADLLTHLSMVHGLLPNFNSSIIGPSWSLSTEVQFYLAFPFLFLLLKSPKQLFRFVFAAALLYWLSNKLLGIWEAPGLLTTFGAPSILIQKLIYFSLGMTVAQFKLGKCRPLVIVLNLSLIWLLSVTPVSSVLCTFIAVLLTATELKPHIPKTMGSIIEFIKGSLSGKVAEFGANISYSFYLVHILMIPFAFRLAMISGISSKSTVAMLTLVYFLILSITISYILFRFIETPYIALGKKLTSTKTKIAAVPAKKLVKV